MSLTNTEIIGGMHRAHLSGQSFTSLLSNPQFASLSLADKKEVLAGLKDRMKEHRPSLSGMAGAVLKNTAIGASAAVPLTALIPMAIEMGPGANKGRILGALKNLSSNKTVRALVGTGAAIGATGGLIRSALDILSDRRDRKALLEGLEDAEAGGEGLAAAVFGGVGRGSARSGFNLDPIVHAVSSTGVSAAIPAARLGYYDAALEEVDPDVVNGVTNRVMEKMRQGYTAQPEALDAYAKKTESAVGHASTMQNILLNSHRDLGYTDQSAQDTIDAITGISQAHLNNHETLNGLSNIARELRDQKRGTH